MPQPRPARRTSGRRAVRRSGRLGVRAGGAVTLTGVVLVASVASLVAPPEPSQEQVTAEAVADVWRSAGTAVPGAASAPGAEPAGGTADLRAELESERDGGGASRSDDRTDDPADGSTDDSAVLAGSGEQLAAALRRAPAAAAGAAAAAPAPGALDATADPVTADAVAVARSQVRALVDQRTADDADAPLAAAAATASAADARSAIDSAQQQREAEAAAAALEAAQADPRSVALPLVQERGWDAAQFRCLDSLWTKESGWRWSADNPTSSAYGIPQSLPGEKMATHGADWATNPATQISWGLQYIADVYGVPCRAWSHSQATDWY